MRAPLYLIALLTFFSSERSASETILMNSTDPILPSFMKEIDPTASSTIKTITTTETVTIDDKKRPHSPHQWLRLLFQNHVEGLTHRQSPDDRKQDSAAKKDPSKRMLSPLHPRKPKTPTKPISVRSLRKKN